MLETLHGKIEQVEIAEEMSSSYLDYAMSVIVGRALPDVRDGLKPVHNRVLYAMFDGGYRPDRAFSKCIRVVVVVEEIQNRICLVVTELPYQVNPDTLAQKIADLVREGKVAGIADIRDETSGRTG